jgi:hypothetical protein
VLAEVIGKNSLNFLQLAYPLRIYVVCPLLIAILGGQPKNIFRGGSVRPILVLDRYRIGTAGFVNNFLFSGVAPEEGRLRIFFARKSFSYLAQIQSI